MTESERNASQKRGILLTVAGLLLVITVIVGGFVRQFVGPQELDPKWLEAHGLFLFEQPRTYDEINFIDKNGEAFDATGFEGAWNFLFFGFTYCPDICPTTLAQLGAVTSQLVDTNSSLPVKVYLVTVDPARDTPELLKPYVEHFGKDYNALTGEFLDIHRFATQMNTPFRKVTDPDNPDNYTVDHSGNIVIINPKGHYAGFIRAPFDNDRLLRVIDTLRHREF